jgi:hypothetical protein
MSNSRPLWRLSRTALAAVAIAAAAAPGFSWAQADRPAPRMRAPMVAPMPDVHTFKCESGGDLVADFTSQNATLVATVDAGDGPHVLPMRQGPYNVPELRWTDGQRTLVWTAGVQIMWMDGSNHRMCGRGGHQH